MAVLDQDRRAGEYLEEMIGRLWRLGIIAALGFLVVALGYWYTQVVRAQHYRRLSENNRLRQAPLKAPRGPIEDRKGRVLVENVPSYNLLFDRSLSRDRDRSLQFASNILGRNAKELDTLLDHNHQGKFVPVLLAESLHLSEVARFEVAGLEHPEFQIEVLQRRLYRHGPQTAHLLGYLGEVTQREMESSELDLKVGDLVGKRGIEQSYDRVLRGRDGRRVLVVDSRGRTIEEYRRDPSQPGQRLRLTLDLDLQQEAHLALAEQVGAIVALDPRDGAIRALVSAPSFDPNRFARRLDPEEWQEIISSPFHVLQNRSVQSAYPPGSVFKVVVSAAGLSEGVIDPDEKVFCRGSSSFYGQNRRCWLAGGHGWLDLHDAIKFSCDVYFYTKGQELGIEAIARYARQFGLGGRTGVDLDGERSGLVPDPEWSLRVPRHRWYPGETLSVAIGQGALLTTPLQLAVLMAAVANGGQLVVPYLVEGDPRPSRWTDIEPEVFAQLRKALYDVVNEGGSGARARVPDLGVAGKTGTAQVVAQRTRTRSDTLPYEQRDHAWFVSFAPAEQAELVVIVFVEHGGLGSRAAAPIAKALYERYFRDRLGNGL